MQQQLNASFETKSLTEDGHFEGYASVFGNVDLGRDVVERGAFSKTVADYANGIRRIRMLFEHETKQIVGVWKGISEDERGLKVSGKLTLGVQKAQEAYALMKDGAIDGLSIGYTIPDGGAVKQNGIRLLKQVDLHEVSIVGFPMNTAASITSVKAAFAAGRIPTITEFETALRDVFGLDRSRAKAIVSAGFKALHQEPRDVSRVVLFPENTGISFLQALQAQLSAR